MLGVVTATFLSIAFILKLASDRGFFRKHSKDATLTISTNRQYDIFLSHSGRQKGFVKDLEARLSSIGYSVFFDANVVSMPLGQRIPSLILSATMTCKIAIVVASDDFFTSRWPMIELCFFAKRQLLAEPFTILPLFYKLSPEDMKTKLKQWRKKWEVLVKQDLRGRLSVAEFEDAATKHFPALNGIVRKSESEQGEGSYIEEVVNKVQSILPRQRIKRRRAFSHNFRIMLRVVTATIAFILKLASDRGFFRKHSKDATLTIATNRQYDIFLSYSGRQKGFVKDLEARLFSIGYSVFFDANVVSLPPGQRIPDLILSAAKTCKIAILVLSEDFFTSRRTMLELCVFVEKLQWQQNADDVFAGCFSILPLYYKVSSADFKTKLKQWRKEWKAFENDASGRMFVLEKCEDAVWNHLPQLNGLVHRQEPVQGDVSYIEDVVNNIQVILPRQRMSFGSAIL